MYATAAPPVFSAVDVKSPGQLGDRPRDGQSKISPATTSRMNATLSGITMASGSVRND